jgi:hypothetical protein
MKTILLSYLRHALTALAGLGGFLAAKGLVAPADAAGLDAAGSSLAEAVAVIAAAVLARGVMHLLGKLQISSSVGAFGFAPLLGMVGTAVAVGALLPSCATTVTKTTLPDGTVVEVTARSSDPAAMDAATAVSGMLLPILIHAEK